MAEPSLIEYRVRPVTRYLVTRFERGDTGSAVSSHGEFDNDQTAYSVGYALACAEHQRLGWALGDERIQYPRQPGALQFPPEPETSVRGVDSEDFHVPVISVLNGARELHSVCVIGLDDHGGVHVASSVGTPHTLNLIRQGTAEVYRLGNTISEDG